MNSLPPLLLREAAAKEAQMDAAKQLDNGAAQLAQAAEARAATLADARRSVAVQHRQEAAEAQAHRSETAGATREAIAQALGANTRLSIARAQSAPIFIYQAIDADTGKVVREWPMQQFAELLNSIRPGAGDALPGLVVDENA
jgi:uncharacterized FlaG/YvyC family protein